MDRNWLVFLIASAVSYFPVYWLLGRVVDWRSPRRPPATESRPRDTRAQFLAFLRHEATVRTDAALSDVLAELMRRSHAAAGDARSLDRKTLSRLHDVRRMLTVLFPADVTAAFDTVVSVVEYATPARTRDAYENILEFKAKLAHGLQARDCA